MVLRCGIEIDSVEWQGESPPIGKWSEWRKRIKRHRRSKNDWWLLESHWRWTRMHRRTGVIEANMSSLARHSSAWPGQWILLTSLSFSIQGRRNWRGRVFFKSSSPSIRSSHRQDESLCLDTIENMAMGFFSMESVRVSVKGRAREKRNNYSLKYVFHWRSLPLRRHGNKWHRRVCCASNFNYSSRSSKQLADLFAVLLHLPLTDNWGNVRSHIRIVNAKCFSKKQHFFFFSSVDFGQNICCAKRFVCPRISMFIGETSLEKICSLICPNRRVSLLLSIDAFLLFAIE